VQAATLQQQRRGEKLTGCCAEHAADWAVLLQVITSQISPQPPNLHMPKQTQSGATTTLSLHRAQCLSVRQTKHVERTHMVQDTHLLCQHKDGRETYQTQVSRSSRPRAMSPGKKQMQGLAQLPA
jgi:hypothetical protein